jgi:hypothetical protein
MSRPVKALLAVVVAAAVGYFFVRSLQSTRSEPYTVRQAHLTGWTPALDSAPGSTGAMLTLRPPQPLAPSVFQQVFTRAMESLTAPAQPGLPLILQLEFDQAFTGRVAPDALLAAAVDAGLGSTPLEPVCLAHRRVSEPGVSRQLYFAIFRSPAFDRFRQRAADLLEAGGGSRQAFDPAALTPMLFIGAADAAFSRWLPLRPDADRDCVAPIVATP